jgi:hypothetical protein
MGKGGMMVVGAQQRGIMNEGLQTGKGHAWGRHLSLISLRGCSEKWTDVNLEGS